jgi:hypothetical protein
MPNINLVQTISTSTDNKSYFVMSDNGLVRRFKVEDFVTELQKTFLDVARTDQNLFTTTDVTFRSVTIHDYATTLASSENQHGFVASAYHPGGTALQSRDYLGTLVFGGFDGRNNTIADNKLATAGVTVYALENWAYNGFTTTNAGTGISLFHNPVNTQLSSTSRNVFLAVSSQGSTASQSITSIRMGTVPNSPRVVTTSSNGLLEFVGPGRADISFVNSRLYQVGVTPEDTSTVNATLLGTNSYTFLTGRRNSYAGDKLPLHNGDTIGTFNFNGITNTTTTLGSLVAQIRVHSTTDYTNSRQGAGMHFRTMSSSTSQLVTTIEIQPEGSKYASDFHIFSDSAFQNPLIIREGFLYFKDGSAQDTAYPGFTSVPAHSTSTGVIGQMAHDTDYIYICIEQNRWKRILALDF